MSFQCQTDFLMKLNKTAQSPAQVQMTLIVRIWHLLLRCLMTVRARFDLVITSSLNLIASRIGPAKSVLSSCHAHMQGLLHSHAYKGRCRPLSYFFPMHLPSLYVVSFGQYFAPAHDSPFIQCVSDGLITLLTTRAAAPHITFYIKSFFHTTPFICVRNPLDWI